MIRHSCNILSMSYVSLPISISFRQGTQTPCTNISVITYPRWSIYRPTRTYRPTSLVIRCGKLIHTKLHKIVVLALATMNSYIKIGVDIPSKTIMIHMRTIRAYKNSTKYIPNELGICFICYKVSQTIFNGWYSLSWIFKHGRMIT